MEKDDEEDRVDCIGGLAKVFGGDINAAGACGERDRL